MRFSRQHLQCLPALPLPLAMLLPQVRQRLLDLTQLQLDQGQSPSPRRRQRQGQRQGLGQQRQVLGKEVQIQVHCQMHHQCQDDLQQVVATSPSTLLTQASENTKTTKVDF